MINRRISRKLGWARRRSYRVGAILSKTLEPLLYHRELFSKKEFDIIVAVLLLAGRDRLYDNPFTKEYWNRLRREVYNLNHDKKLPIERDNTNIVVSGVRSGYLIDDDDIIIFTSKELLPLVEDSSEYSIKRNSRGISDPISVEYLTRQFYNVFYTIIDYST